jgi:thymidylate kinase
MIVILEGLDKTGKTTVKLELEKQTKYKHMVVDRLWMSYLSYAKLNKRRISIDDVKRTIPEDKNNVLIIYLTCLPQMLQARLISAGHELIDIEAHKEAFDESKKIMLSLGLKVVTIPTTMLSPRDTTKRIIYHINMMERYVINKQR